MALTDGTRLGPYEILASIGAGGMGEVYKARDTKLGRDVAIKVLPPDFAQDPERLARFEREAKVLASLNHPNIAQIYGIEDRALIMELVEGQTLQGPLPLETALDYAKQIADALEAAHDKGIIHRDLKPANIMVTPAGVVKVLDFGLAAVAQSSDPSNPANSPTLTISPTRAGMILGTAAYMSPEQARGKAVDKRADIWAFGVVLYEMLTGKRLFQGEDLTETLASVVKEEPRHRRFAGCSKNASKKIRSAVCAISATPGFCWKAHPHPRCPRGRGFGPPSRPYVY
jgi:serine/threonine-protein kinase